MTKFRELEPGIVTLTYLAYEEIWEDFEGQVVAVCLGTTKRKDGQGDTHVQFQLSPEQATELGNELLASAKALSGRPPGPVQQSWVGSYLRTPKSAVATRKATVPSNDNLSEVIDAVGQAAIVLIEALFAQSEQDRTPATAIAMLKKLADIAAKDEEISPLAKATFSRFSQLFETALSLRDVKSRKIN